MERRIQILDPKVAEKIAAGEVVERPASVVKELIENSLDAGASRICVNLEDGGKAKIEIIDNGIGMSPEDLELCISRHATSKLKVVEDLESLASLGFRGEALPSIAAVADLSITSRTAESASAYELSAQSVSGRFGSKPRAEKVSWGNFIDTTHGTRILVCSLFAQIPARLKFLRSQTSEVTQIKEWMERLAIAYPQVGFQLISDDRTIMQLQPEDEKSRIQSVLGDGDETRIISSSHGQDGKHDLGLQARAHWLEGLSLRQNKKLIQVVNGRAVRDRLLQQALLGPFRQALMPGQFPAIALFLDIHPAAIDVNVHPSKTELRFLDTKKIFQTVDALAKSLIAKRGERVGLASSALKPESASDSASSSSLNDEPPIVFERRTFPPPERDYFSYSQSHLSPTSQFSSSFSPNPSQASEKPPLFQARDSETAPPHLLTHARYVGTFFLTYFAYELGDELILIDQHAAHERIRYENLQNQIFGTPQSLLIPETIRFSPELLPLIDRRMSFLNSIGFESELFGEDALLFRAVPAEWGNHNLKLRLKALLDRIIQLEGDESVDSDRSLLLDERLFEALASEACHSSVRAGDSLNYQQILSLADKLFQCEHPWNCPHGRPTLVRMPKRKVEEWFQRTV